MMLTLAVVLSRSGIVASPADAVEYCLVDLSSGALVSGPQGLPGNQQGLSRLGILAASLIPRGVEAFVVSRIGVEGLELLKGLGVKVLSYTGSLEDLMRSRRDLEEILEPSKECPCCALKISRHRHS